MSADPEAAFSCVGPALPAEFLHERGRGSIWLHERKDRQLNPLQKLLDFLSDLDGRNIFYKLSRDRSEAIMVEIAVPGERWEVEFFADGHVEVEVFGPSRGIVGGEEALRRLYDEFSD